MGVLQHQIHAGLCHGFYRLDDGGAVVVLISKGAQTVVADDLHILRHTLPHPAQHLDDGDRQLVGDAKDAVKGQPSVLQVLF